MVEEELAAATDDGDGPLSLLPVFYPNDCYADPVAEANDEVEVGKAPEPEHEVPIVSFLLWCFADC